MLRQSFEALNLLTINLEEIIIDDLKPNDNILTTVSAQQLMEVIISLGIKGHLIGTINRLTIQINKSKLIDEIINLFIASLDSSLVLKRLTKRYCEVLISLIGNLIDTDIIRNNRLALEEGQIQSRVDRKLLIAMIKVIKSSSITHRNQSIAIHIYLICINAQHISLGCFLLEIEETICNTTR